jgi:hypothetical protein
MTTKKEQKFSIQGTSHDYIGNKKLGGKTNQGFTGNTNLFSEINQDYKGSKHLGCIRNQDYGEQNFNPRNK